MNLKLFSVILLSIAPSMVHALGLGGISLKSTLDQPLKAQIEILGAKEQDTKELEITLASDAIYERMGIERNPLIEKMQFSLSQSSDGKYFIDVRTPNALTEPFINFLIEINWSAGRLLREFTILLDPPVLLEEQAPLVSSPKAEMPNSFSVTVPASNIKSGGFAISEPVLESRQVRREEFNPGDSIKTDETETAKVEKKAVKSKEFSTTLRDGVAPQKNDILEYKPVKKNEILWNIAESMRPKNITVEQMMLALQRENPKAFFGATVSHLKEGSVLRINDVSTLSELSADSAILEIARQHQEWLAYRKIQQAKNAVAAESTKVELEGAEPNTPKSASNVKLKKEARLELVTPIDESSGKETQTNVSLQAAEDKLSELNIELTLANEAVEASKRENEDLLNRLASLEEQMSAMQNLVQLKDAQLSRIQSRLSDDTGNSNEHVSGVTLDITNNENFEKNIIEQKDVHSKGIEETIRHLMDDYVTIATIIFIGLLVALIAWITTRRSSLEDDAEAYGEKSIEELFPEQIGADQKRKVVSEHLDVGESKNFVGLEPLTEIAIPDTEFASGNENLFNSTVAADEYLADKNFDEVEKLLQSAIEAEPNKQELKLKLLDVYFQKNDVEAFDNQADILFASIAGNTDSEIWRNAQALAQKIGSINPVFKQTDTSDAKGTQFVEKYDLVKTEEAQSLSGNAETVWAPEQVTDVVAEKRPFTQFQTKFDNNVVKPEVTEFVASEDQSKSFAFEPLTVTENPGIVVTDDELNKAMNSFTDDVLDRVDDSELEKQDHAVVELLNDIQIANPNIHFNEDYVLDKSSMFLLSDEIGTKLDLAKAYIEMGDQEGAVDLLNEVLDEGNSKQKNEAKELLELT